jgi:PleD family two-component response regulator
MMLHSPLDSERANECKRLGITTILKPLRRLMLLQALHGQKAIQGTTAAVPRSSSATDRAAGADTAGLRILLAEDNIVNQRLISRILEKMGHTVAIANDGVTALGMLAQQEFDLIAMDMQMPLMDGLEATQKIP